MLHKGPVSFCSFLLAAPVAPQLSRGGRREAGKWDREVLHLWVLALLGLIGVPWAGDPRGWTSQRDSAEPPGRRWDTGTWEQSFVLVPIHTPCHYAPSPPVHGSLKCFSCVPVEESYFLRQQWCMRCGEKNAIKK